MFEITKYKKELHKLYEEESRLNNKRYELEEEGTDTGALSEIKKEIHTITEKIDALIETEYSKAVFEKYNKTKPILIRNTDSAEIPWDDAFGDDYESVSKSLRHSLVGLIEGTGRYTLKKN